MCGSFLGKVRKKDGTGHSAKVGPPGALRRSPLGGGGANPAGSTRLALVGKLAGEVSYVVD